MADSLRDELLSIPGIEEAEFEGEGPTPAGVRVRLSADADTDTVGEEVRRVLATHGMRSQVATPGDQPIPPPPPGAPASVVTLPGVSIAPPPEVPESPAEVVEELPEPEVRSVSRPVLTSTKLQSVAVEEGREGVVVRVTAAGGATAERRARAGGAGLDAAVVSAVGQLLAPTAAPPLVVEVLDHEVGGTSVVTIVIELGDGSRRVGSAVSEAGRVYAVGYATWQALSDG